MITSGSTQGLRIVAGLLRGDGDTVLVEDPVHTGLLEVVARAGYAVEGLRADERGMDTSALETFSRQKAACIAFAYVTPSHQYPLGGVLPVQRRQALISFAQEFGCRIVEDDYDSEFRYEGAPLSSLYELAPETVVYLGSFSKILAPAMRLGFAIVPETLQEPWRREKLYTDVHTDALSQHALAAFISGGGLERHIWKMRKLYQRKRARLLQSLARHFGDRFEVRGQAAGLHLVAAFIKPPFEIRSYELPDYILRDERELLKKSNSEDLREVMNKIYGHIYCIVNLMSLFPAEEAMDGVLVNEVADILLVPLDWLEQLCSTFVGFRLVHHMKTE